MKVFWKLTACIAVAAAYVLLLIYLPISAATFALGIFVCNYFANLLHETGHLLAYLVLGLKWKRMVFSFFLLEAGHGIRFDAAQKVYAASCTCAYDPAVPYWRYCLALLSGSILGGIGGVVAVLLSFVTAGGFSAFCLCFGIVSLLNAAYNLLPFSPDRTLMKQIRQQQT